MLQESMALPTKLSGPFDIEKPLCIDLFCGLGGWADGFLAEGWRIIGFDIERHDYGSGGYPAQLILQDVLTIHGSQFRDATCIVASPPCQRYSYMAMPWKRAKALIAWHKESPERIRELNALFDACFRIQLEASKAAGRYIPMVVENVRGAQPWVGRAKAAYGSFMLWGDVRQVGRRIYCGIPGFGSDQYLLAPRRGVMKGGDRNKNRAEGHAWTSSFADTLNVGQNRDGRKLPGNNSERRWEDREVKRLGDATKGAGGTWFGDYQAQREMQDSIKQGGDWFGPSAQGSMSRRFSSKSNARKAASAQIAKIPLPLSRHIARCFKGGLSRT